LTTPSYGGKTGYQVKMDKQANQKDWTGRQNLKDGQQ
jgi:hypothetical protein